MVGDGDENGVSICTDGVWRVEYGMIFTSDWQACMAHSYICNLHKAWWPIITGDNTIHIKCTLATRAHSIK